MISLLAISGGIDSIVLLDAFAYGRLSELTNDERQTTNNDRQKKSANEGRRTKNQELTIVHFNHHIHARADAHQKFVEALAKKYALPIYVGHAKTKLTSEATARVARYAFLQTLAKKLKADAIVTAHHADDQAETVLFNLIRGSGLAGLAGMKQLKINNEKLTMDNEQLRIKNEEFKIWRPLLNMSKSAIQKYAKKYRLKFVTDPTNADEKYARNFLRKKVLPILRKLNPQIQTALLRTARQAREANEFISALADQWLEQNKIKNCLSSQGDKFKNSLKIENCKSKIISAIPLKKFLATHPTLTAAIIRKIHLTAIGNLCNLEEVHVAEILTLARSGIGNKEKRFGKLVFRTRRVGNERVLGWEKN